MIMSHSIHSVIRSHCPKTVLSVFVEYMVLWYLTLFNKDTAHISK